MTRPSPAYVSSSRGHSPSWPLRQCDMVSWRVWGYQNNYDEGALDHSERRWWTSVRRGCQARECLGKVGLEVVGMFEPDVEPHKPAIVG